MKTKAFVIVAGLIMCMPPLASATLIDSNSITQDGVEYYMQTDKSVYDLGEDVEMLYRVTNLGAENVTFEFPQSPEWNFWVEEDGEHIWRAVNGWWTELTSFTLLPSESKEFPYAWNMKDDEGSLVNVGVYEAIGGLYAASGEYDYSRVGVSIEIVPEPSSIALVTLGFIGIVLSRKQRVRGVR